jgi:phosphoribosylformimino-5-aminoimidazole carboxamide ribotide isomerase
MRYLLVIPSIDIKDGKTARVVQGIPELDCKEYCSDPVEMAKIWRAENAKMLHVVDFDGARNPFSKNLKLIEKICESVVIPVEYAGGIRSLDDASAMLNTGICRLVIGTMPIENFAEFKKLFEKYGPTKVAVSLDIINDEIMIRGRQVKTGISYKVFVKQMAEIGIQRFIVTDILRNGVLSGPNIELSLEIAKLTNAKITHSGGIRNKDELMDLQNLIPLGIDSAIVGRALYENRFPCQKLWRIAEAGIFN